MCNPRLLTIVNNYVKFMLNIPICLDNSIFLTTFAPFKTKQLISNNLKQQVQLCQLTTFH